MKGHKKKKNQKENFLLLRKASPSYLHKPPASFYNDLWDLFPNPLALKDVDGRNFWSLVFPTTPHQLNW